MAVVTIEPETAEDEARLIELLPTIHGRVVATDDNKSHWLMMTWKAACTFSLKTAG